jgi:hypothetical protein
MRSAYLPEVLVSEPFEPSALFPAPDDLTTVSDGELATLESEGVAEFDRVHGLTEYAPEMVAYAMQLREDLDRVKAELSARKVRSDQTAAAARSRAEQQMAQLQEAVHGPADGTPEGAVQAAKMDAGREDSIAAAAARGTTAALVQLLGNNRNGLTPESVGSRAVASLSAAAAAAPKLKAPEARLAITASGNGQELPSLAALGQAFTDKVGNIPTTSLGRQAPRHSVARIRNEFTHTVDDRVNPFDVQAMHRDLISKGGDNAAALVAGGGWCAPSEIMYQFFNIAGNPRTIDLPTVGVTRGGIQFPVSPAIGDVFFQAAGSNPASGFGSFAFPFSNASDPWLWTETDDILTVTGSINKPTLRVPCSSFLTQRLEAYGLTVTAGNLTDSAYPEQTQNFISLLRSAYAHAINARLISLLVAASASAITVGDTAGAAVPQIVNATGFAATDYRTRYAMDEDAVLEVVFPYWALEAMRSDLGYRPGVDDTTLMAVADATIVGLFTSRNVRPQFVSDYQVRGSTQFGLPTASARTTWPTAVTFMLYAAGTFLHGQGMSLDLGVVRDSILNAENDFTAAWAEETHLVAKVGHESRQYTVNFNVGGDLAQGITGPKI